MNDAADAEGQCFDVVTAGNMPPSLLKVETVAS